MTTCELRCSRTDEDFGSWFRSITQLDERIRHLSILPILTDQQQFEEISLKKRKLALKDRIEAIVRDRTIRASLASTR